MGLEPGRQHEPLAERFLLFVHGEAGTVGRELEQHATGLEEVDRFEPEAVDDLEAMRIARDVSQKIEETMEYPGQIKVTVVRETRATEFAR